MGSWLMLANVGVAHRAHDFRVRLDVVVENLVTNVGMISQTTSAPPADWRDAPASPQFLLPTACRAARRGFTTASRSQQHIAVTRVATRRETPMATQGRA